MSSYRTIHGFLSLLLLVLVRVRPSLASNVQYTKLVNHLFTNYKKEIRPVSNFLNPTRVSLHMSLIAIDDLEERNQILVSSVKINVNYVDEYLAWNTSQFGGIDILIYPQRELWLPDLVVENSVEKMEQLGYNEMTLLVSNWGNVVWTPKAVLRTVCNVDVTYYPFDTQTCSVILSTWTSMTKDIVLQIHSLNRVDLRDYQESGAWELLDATIEDVSGSYSQNRISFNFTIKRRKAYYVLNLIVPVIALCATASLVFGLPAEAGEKIGMSITVLLAYAVYLTIISESMPRTSLQVSIMGVYLSILLTATALAVVFTVFVLDVHHRDNHLPPGDRWRYFTIKIRPWIGLHDLRKEMDHNSLGQNSHSDRTSSAMLVTKNQQKEKTTQKISSVFRTKKVGVAIDHTCLQRDKGNDAENKKTNFPNVAMEKEMAVTLLWSHVAETVDRALFIIFTSFTAVPSIVFICLLTFGN